MGGRFSRVPKIRICSAYGNSLSEQNGVMSTCHRLPSTVYRPYVLRFTLCVLRYKLLYNWCRIYLAWKY